jgi:hypothetical protein
MIEYKKGDRVWYYFHQWQTDSTNFRNTGWQKVKSKATITKVICKNVYEISTDKIIYTNGPLCSKEGKQHGITTQMTELKLII